MRALQSRRAKDMNARYTQVHLSRIHAYRAGV